MSVGKEPMSVEKARVNTQEGEVMMSRARSQRR